MTLQHALVTLLCCLSPLCVLVCWSAVAINKGRG